MVRDIGPEEYRNNILAHAAIGNVFSLPTILTTSAETGAQIYLGSRRRKCSLLHFFHWIALFRPERSLAQGNH
jgi:hypothetical protein